MYLLLVRYPLALTCALCCYRKHYIAALLHGALHCYIATLLHGSVASPNTLDVGLAVVACQVPMAFAVSVIPSRVEGPVLEVAVPFLDGLVS